MSGREYVERRLVLYNARACLFAFCGGMSGMLGVGLGAFSRTIPGYLGLMIVGAFTFLGLCLSFMWLSSHFTEKAQRIRKRLDSYQGQ